MSELAVVSSLILFTQRSLAFTIPQLTDRQSLRQEKNMFSNPVPNHQKLSRLVRRFVNTLTTRSSASTSSMGNAPNPTSNTMSGAMIGIIVLIVVASIIALTVMACLIRRRSRMAVHGAGGQYPFPPATGFGPKYYSRYHHAGPGDGFYAGGPGMQPPPPAYTETATHRHQRHNLGDSGATGTGMSSGIGAGMSNGMGGGTSGTNGM